MAFQNFYSSKVSNDIGVGDVTIIVDSAPTATSGRMVLEARNSTQREVIKYTGVSGNTLTGVLRAQGGTTAKPHLKGSLIELNVTAEDLQDLYDAFASFSAANTDWRNLVGNAITSVVDNGNRSYTVNFTTSVAALLAAGMRCRTTRTVAAPNLSAQLNGTTQYFNRTTAINGFTATNNITAMAWVKPTAYGGTVIARGDATTNGFQLTVQPTGQVLLVARNGGGNFRYINTTSTISLNRWTHVAVTLDLAGWTSATNKLFIDGVEVPASFTSAGSNPTSFVNTGDLAIGRDGSASTGYWPGYLDQVAVFSSILPLSTILSYKNQGLLGTEPTLMSAYSLSGGTGANDLNTSNANNLTAQNSAITTATTASFGGQADGTSSTTQDYGIIQRVAGTAVTVQVPEGCTIPTIGGVSSFAYSGVKAPYAMSVSEDKWTVETRYKITLSSPVFAATGVWTQIAAIPTSLAVPVGAWDVGFRGEFHHASSVAGGTSGFIVLSDTTPVNGNYSNDLQSRQYAPNSGGSVANVISAAYMRKPVVTTAVANYGFYGTINSSPGGSNTWLIRGDEGEVVVFAKNNYL